MFLLIDLVTNKILLVTKSVQMYGIFRGNPKCQNELIPSFLPLFLFCEK